MHTPQPTVLAASEQLKQYPAGALLRVKDICGDRQHGKPGLLPIVSRTWLKWVEQGKVPEGILLGARTRVWPVEQVLAVREGLKN
ncbi:transcriptional regulator, AlpA family [Variovorax sp. OK605]|nr:transcriptional regulator, AlpA family [Variovorax sp. OK605]